MSGGVDSSVAAALLKKAGYAVTGVFIRTWQPDFIVCTERDERRDAIRVCAALDIPFLECDAVEAYKKSVADYMIEEYRLGRTPNPDVMCNREIKFGVFWDFAKSHGADYIATGHYTRTEDGKLMTGNDPAKDQSYFLWTLTPEDLSHVLFPIGHLPKSEVRKLAEKFGLPTAAKKDSQGICMLGKLDLKEFLSAYIKPERGDVLDEQGTTIGHHEGAVFLTIGERHGFTITTKGTGDAPQYVVAKDIKRNTVTVSHQKSKQTAGGKEINIRSVNWINTPKENKQYECQIRYHGERLKCSKLGLAQNTATIVFNAPVMASPGQSLVVYDGDICMGGGVIS